MDVKNYDNIWMNLGQLNKYDLIFAFILNELKWKW